MVSRTIVNTDGNSRNVSFTTARVRTRLAIAVGGLGLDHAAAGFLGEPCLFLGRFGQHDDRPEQRDRGRFVTGENQGRDLIAKLRRGEAAPVSGSRAARNRSNKSRGVSGCGSAGAPPGSIQ